MISQAHLKSWAAGFLDGEGCFTIEVKRYRDSRKQDRYLRPRLAVQVRRDDEVALRRLQEAIETPGYFYRRKARKVSTYGSVSKPTTECAWHCMDDVKAVVKLLDEYPLLGKKARDYAIWRKAVLIYTNTERPSRERQEALEPLREVLMESKKYKAHPTRARR